MACLLFVAEVTEKSEICGKRILEIGARDESGSVRHLFESWLPKEYVGVDIREGKGVDIVCDAENLLTVFPKESFDVIVSTETLEHVRDWRKVISNMKNLCKKNGIILITTRSKGFPFHAFPHDFWRYEREDMVRLFSDCELIRAASDWERDGILVKVRKPESFKETDLSNHELHSMVTGNRVRQLDGRAERSPSYYLKLQHARFREWLYKSGHRVFERV